MQLFTRFPDGSYRAFNAVVAGDVTLGADSSLWFNVVVRGDVAPVLIGRRVNLQENVVVHCDSGFPNTIEDDVTVGHGAIIHGQHVGRGSLIGMGAMILAQAKIGRECVIAAGTVVPPEMAVPDRQVVMGVPGRIVRAVSDAELEHMRWAAGHYIELAKGYVGREGESPAAP